MTTLENQPRPVAQRGDAKYSWDDAIAAIGKDFSGGRVNVGQEKIEYTSVVRYCEVWEIGNPIYWYEDVAKQAGYKGVVAPWSSIKQTFTYTGFWRPGDPSHFPVGIDINANTFIAASPEEEEVERVPKPPTSQGIVTDLSIELFEPVLVGDTLTVKGSKLVNVRPRETRIGVGAFMNRESLVLNQRGELVVRLNQGGFSYNPK